MILLDQSERQTILGLVKEHARDQPYRVLVFGSRANGTAQRYSDVDLALVGEQPVPIGITASLTEAFDSSMLPYTVDIVDYASAGEQLRRQIDQYGKELMQI